MALSALAAYGQAVAVQTEPAPRLSNGTVNLGSDKEHKGYWEIRPGLGGFRPAGVPFQPWAQALFQYRQKSMKDSPLVDCVPATGPSFINAPGFEIVDVPELKEVFIIDMAGPHSWRVIYMDGRQHPGQGRRSEAHVSWAIPSATGKATRSWSIRSASTKSSGRSAHSPLPINFISTERFSRPNLKTLKYEVTIDDPGAYTKTLVWRMDNH